MIFSLHIKVGSTKETKTKSELENRQKYGKTHQAKLSWLQSVLRLVELYCTDILLNMNEYSN